MMKYIYKCNICSHEFEKNLTLKDIRKGKPPKFLCPVCGKPSRKLINVPAIQFRGTGFYSTDNKKADTK